MQQVDLAIESGILLPTRNALRAFTRDGESFAVVAPPRRPLSGTNVSAAASTVLAIDFDPRGSFPQGESARQAIEAVGRTPAALAGARATVHWDSACRAWLIQAAEPWLPPENPKSRRQIALVQALCLEFIARALPTLTRVDRPTASGPVARTAAHDPAEKAPAVSGDGSAQNVRRP